MQDRRVQVVLAVVTLFILLGSGVGLWAARHPAPPPIVITGVPSADAPPTAPASAAHAVAAPPVQPSPTPAPETRYYVHVAGAVRHPSLYLLPPDSRVMQAIKAAGGPTSKADLDAVNLAEKVKDGEKVYIPNKAAVAQASLPAPPGSGVERGVTAAAPSGAPVPAATPAAPKTAKSGAGKSNKLSSPSQGQVNINTAGNDQLQRLPGVGPAMAGRILAYRQQAGGFQKVEELQEISGIGPKKYAKIAPLVKLQ